MKPNVRFVIINGQLSKLVTDSGENWGSQSQAAPTAAERQAFELGVREGKHEALEALYRALGTCVEGASWTCPDCGLFDCECEYVLTDKGRETLAQTEREREWQEIERADREEFGRVQSEHRRHERARADALKRGAYWHTTPTLYVEDSACLGGLSRLG